MCVVYFLLLCLMNWMCETFLSSLKTNAICPLCSISTFCLCVSFRFLSVFYFFQFGNAIGWYVRDGTLTVVYAWQYRKIGTVCHAIRQYDNLNTTLNARCSFIQNAIYQIAKGKKNEYHDQVGQIHFPSHTQCKMQIIIIIIGSNEYNRWMTLSGID